NLGAHDFGYITLGELLDRCERTTATLGRMETYGGHLFNWYDTQTLEPLPPRYVSSVDSGNLVAAVRTLILGLEDLADEPPVGRQCWSGLADSLRLFLDTVLGRERVALETGEVLARKLKLGDDLLNR